MVGFRIVKVNTAVNKSEDCTIITKSISDETRFLTTVLEV